MKNNNCVIAARLATSSWSRKAPACHPEPIRQAQGKLRAKHVVEGSIVAILLAMFLTACGDSDGASANNGSATLEDVYASEDDLPGCTEKYDGAVAFVKEGSTAFKCEDGRWENKGEYYANNDAIKNCTSKREGEIAYIVDEDKSLVCQDGKWVKASDKVGEPAEGTSSSSSVILNDSEESSSSNASTSSSWNEVTESSSSIKDKGGEPAEPAEVSSSSNATSSSSWSEAIGSCSAQTPSSSSAEESSSSVASSSSIPFSYGVLNDDRDGKTYRTIKIGNLEWMAENLNFDPGQGGSGDEKYDWSWCYDNKLSNCEKYGRLYTWAAAVDSSAVFSENAAGCGDGKKCSIKFPVRGICPNGWHIPDAGVNGWRADEVCPDCGDGTRKLQEKGIEAWPNATNEYGFSALPAGGYGNGSFKDIGRMAYFWGAPEVDKERSFRVVVGDGNSSFGSIKSYAFSVRCVKD